MVNDPNDNIANSESFTFNPIWHTRGGLFGPPISYTVITNLTGLTSWDLFYSHKIYFYMFLPNLDKFFAEGHEISPLCGREV